MPGPPVVHTQSQRNSSSGSISIDNGFQCPRVNTTAPQSEQPSKHIANLTSSPSAAPLPPLPLVLPPSNPALPIQLPTKPLDLSEVSDFGLNSSMTSKPPPDVASGIVSSNRSKPSTVSLLRGLRLKKSSQHLSNNGSISSGDTKYSPSAASSHAKKADSKKMFARPFEDNYQHKTTPNLFTGGNTVSEDTITTYQMNSNHASTDKEQHNITVSNNSMLPSSETNSKSFKRTTGDFNFCVPVSLESNLKHIEQQTLSRMSDDNISNITKRKRKALEIESKNENHLLNNNNIINTKQVMISLRIYLLMWHKNLRYQIIY